MISMVMAFSCPNILLKTGSAVGCNIFLVITQSCRDLGSCKGENDGLGGRIKREERLVTQGVISGDGLLKIWGA
jgi:hypothetical protein